MKNEFSHYSFLTRNPISLDGRHPKVLFPLITNNHKTQGEAAVAEKQIPVLDQNLFLMIIKMSPELDNPLIEVGNPVYEGGFDIGMVVDDKGEVKDFKVDIMPTVIIEKEVFGSLTAILNNNQKPQLTRELREVFEEYKPQCVIEPNAFTFLTGKDCQFSIGKNINYKRDDSVEIMGVGVGEKVIGNDWAMGLSICFSGCRQAFGSEALFLTIGFRTPYYDASSMISGVQYILEGYNKEDLRSLDVKFRRIVEPYLKISLFPEDSSDNSL